MNANRLGFSAWLGPPGPRAVVVAVFSAVLLSACAESDPYKRIETVPIGSRSQLVLDNVQSSYNSRWPERFKSVQTVTIDFGPVTRTFSALIVFQLPGSFRIQGLTEQGIKIFDLIHDGNGDRVVFRADDMSDETIAAVSRDIRRVYLSSLTGRIETELSDGEVLLTKDSFALTTQIRMAYQPDPPIDVSYKPFLWLDSQSCSNREGELYSFRQYEWKAFHRGITYLPSVIVLRDSGRESKSYPYKLTIKISELTVRIDPWPEKTFKP